MFPCWCRLLTTAKCRLRSSALTDCNAIACDVAPDDPCLGVILPYTPLHHLSIFNLGFPLVATSGNLSNQPIAIDEHEALSRLGAIADLFVVHDRRIVRPIDDSVARMIAGRDLLLRGARGYAPPFQEGIRRWSLRRRCASDLRSRAHTCRALRCPPDRRCAGRG